MEISGVSVLYGGRGLLVLNKPPAMISQGPMLKPEPEVHELLKVHRCGYLAHRIDYWTSGLLLAGDWGMRGYLMRNWHRITKKYYLAIIREPRWKAVSVFALVDGKTATTTFMVLERKDGYALVRCELVRNGRTHQIRKHLQELGHPIVGDRTYSGPPTRARKGQLLHAWRIRVRLPGQSKEMAAWSRFQAPIPADFKEAVPFNWELWDEKATRPVGRLEIPRGWKRPLRPAKTRAVPTPVQL